jgi:hypothetical protein
MKMAPFETAPFLLAIALLNAGRKSAKRVIRRLPLPQRGTQMVVASTWSSPL